MPLKFLHEHADFKTLVDLTARELKIEEPSLVEKDYWIMHSLYGLKSIELEFELKGGTSLSKGYGLIHRFSEDIDIRIEPDLKVVGFEVFSGKNHDKEKHRDSRRRFYEWLTQFLKGKIRGIEDVTRDSAFDDEHKWRNAGIRLHYSASFPSAGGLKDGILLEVGFDRTAPNASKDISSWAFDRAKASSVDLIDNKALQIPCYEPRYTFVEKLQAVVRKYRLYKEGGAVQLPRNFLRHYYDLYQLIDLLSVQAFIGTEEYETFKKERFGGDDTKVANSEAFRLTDKPQREFFDHEFAKTRALYYRGQPPFGVILQRIAQHLEKL